MKTLKRRRKENKTDYGKRIKLLKSGKPRVVFRKSNKYVLAQYVVSKEAQDKIIMSVNSKDLMKFGWPKEAEGSLKSVPASYLTGYLIGKKILKDKLETPIIDFGMSRTEWKTKVYGFLKGIIDSGIKISCKEEAFPEEERIKGTKLKNKINFEEIKGKIK
jgi:large subunit ribosomal protein L18